MPEEGNTSPKGATAVLDLDDDMGFEGQRVPPDEDFLKQLRFFFPDALVLAALDIIDRDGVIKYMSPLQRIQYQVVGTKRNCYVFPGLPVWTDSGVNRYFCDCPAFTLSVLSAESNLMCKHLLATYLADKLGRAVERKLGFEEWAALISENH
ncbi:hypothetical protein BDM02DRAFT_3120507 [Thelephora ganbajun]|uniref:Uncharacterized protein n=1 Tax=Thelephora ganbajun TaxID=370292 RepID=A0ACB6Z6C2_THEGA|nr:hypothetical protein BDM02DRAFT_3120507 [Thelephora ganbajun]